MTPSTPSPPATLETARLRLRRPQMDDAPAIYARYASDPEVTRYLPWRPHRDVEETRIFLSSLLSSMANGRTHAWIIESKEDCRLVGLVSMGIQSAREGDLLRTEEESCYYKVGFGYHLARSEWGRGYATEAARAVVDWALDQPRIFRIWTLCDIENVASLRVLEREGVLKRWSIRPNLSPEPRDSYCYAITR